MVGSDGSCLVSEPNTPIAPSRSWSRPRRLLRNRLELLDLVDMHIKLLRQFRQRLLALDRSKRCLRLESRGVVPACSSCHFGSCSQRILRRSQAETPLIPAVQIPRATSQWQMPELTRHNSLATLKRSRHFEELLSKVPRSHPSGEPLVHFAEGAPAS
jgi:hypothetical protein